jgi:hypothetical protein
MAERRRPRVNEIARPASEMMHGSPKTRTCEYCDGRRDRADRDADNVNWACSTTLDDGSDIYVVNRVDNTIVRIHQNGAWSRYAKSFGDGSSFNDVRLNGITTSTTVRRSMWHSRLALADF